MSRPTRRTARLLKWIAVPAALLASGAAVATGSYSAFSATTVNPTSNWATGTVALGDDDQNTAMFTATNLKPGSSGSKCIAVTSSGSLPSTVKLYGTDAATTKDLSGSINLTITQGTGGGTSGCGSFAALTTNAAVFSGTLASFAGATAFDKGLPAAGAWTPTGSASETRVFKFEYSIPTDAKSSIQGGTATIGFTWEAQNS